MILIVIYAEESGYGINYLEWLRETTKDNIWSEVLTRDLPHPEYECYQPNLEVR
jgi:hypothetical protein